MLILLLDGVELEDALPIVLVNGARVRVPDSAQQLFLAVLTR